MQCTIEIHHHGQWHTAALFEPAETVHQQGYRSPGRLSYDVAYAGQYLHSGISHALSCRYPLGFELHNEQQWPAFLLDILPAGAGRRFWLQRLQQHDGATADWSLLVNGSGNPIGNLRVREASMQAAEDTTEHAGFSYEDVVEHQSDFIEYAWQHGAPVAGSSGAQGDAPKFLLTQDKQHRWHSDGALADSCCHKHWLLKFPKSARLADLRVLRNEAAYYEVARWFGVRTGEALRLDNDALFIPRFDRIVQGDGVTRLGVGSLASLAGVSEFGAATSQNSYCHAIATHTTAPQQELLEFVRRDVLNTALGNTDNHGRNTAVIRYADNQVLLSPLYDFAPMILDPQGIARVSRWETRVENGCENGLEKRSEEVEEQGRPRWKLLTAYLCNLGCEESEVLAMWRELAEKVPQLPAVMQRSGVDAELIVQLQGRITAVSKHLQEALL
jgi:serine/threonine-protein kinase HipA